MQKLVKIRTFNRVRSIVERLKYLRVSDRVVGGDPAPEILGKAKTTKLLPRDSRSKKMTMK